MRAAATLIAAAALVSGCGGLSKEEEKETEKFKFVISLAFDQNNRPATGAIRTEEKTIEEHVATGLETKTIGGLTYQLNGLWPNIVDSLHDVPEMHGTILAAYGVHYGLWRAQMDRQRNVSVVILNSQMDRNKFEVPPRNNEFGFSFGRYATELKGGCWALHLWGASDHEGQTNGNNERHPGLGIRHYFDCGENWFGSVDFLSRNSKRGRTDIFSLGYEREIVEFWDIEILAGGALAYTVYRIPPIQTRRRTIPGQRLELLIPSPTLSIRTGVWSLNLIGILIPDAPDVILAFVARKF